MRATPKLAVKNFANAYFDINLINESKHLPHISLHTRALVQIIRYIISTSNFTLAQSCTHSLYKYTPLQQSQIN